MTASLRALLEGYPGIQACQPSGKSLASAATSVVTACHGEKLSAQDNPEFRKQLRCLTTSISPLKSIIKWMKSAEPHAQPWEWVYAYSQCQAGPHEPKYACVTHPQVESGTSVWVNIFHLNLLSLRSLSLEAPSCFSMVATQLGCHVTLSGCLDFDPNVLEETVRYVDFPCRSPKACVMRTSCLHTYLVLLSASYL
jgi:hypothetical protein